MVIMWCAIGLMSLLSIRIRAYNVPLTVPAGALSNASLDTVFIAKAALFFAILLLWTVFVSKLCKRLFKLPIIAGQIVGGILLGPSCINIARWIFFSSPLYIFDHSTQQVYALVSSDLFIFFLAILSSVFTISYLLWIAGYETNVKDISSVGIPAVSAGFFGALFPVVFSWLVLSYGWSEEVSTVQAVAMGLIFSATSVSIPVAMLFSSNKMHLKSSQATLGAAIIDDILAVVLLSLFFISIQAGTFGTDVFGLIEGGHATTIGEALVYMLFTFVAFIFIGYYGIPFISQRLRCKEYYHLIPTVANVVMLLYFALAELLGGLAGITGAYFAGFFHKLGDAGHEAERVISPFVNTILLPLFLGSIGLTVDISLLQMHHWSIVGVLLVVAIISKLLACYLAVGIGNLFETKAGRWSSLEGYLFGSSMVARGEVGLVIATILYGAKLIQVDYYVISLVIIILTTIASPIMLGIGFAFLNVQQIENTEDEYSVNMGIFKVFGTLQLFNIIVNHIEKIKGFHPSIQMSEGKKIISLEDQNVNIVFSPTKGIIFKGDPHHIASLVNSIRDELKKELDRIAVA